jgi:hypothetical protein
LSRKIISVLLVFMMAATLVLPALADVQYGDEVLSAESATRADAVAAFYRYAGEPSVAFESIFSDVAQGEWFSDAAIWASNEGLIPGFAGGLFSPDQEVTREELAAMFVGAANLVIATPVNAPELLGYQDAADVSDWATMPLSWCVTRGVLDAYNRVLDPAGNVAAQQITESIIKFDALKYDSSYIWVLNPLPTRSPIEAVGLAPRVTDGEGKTVGFLANYNGSTTTIGAEFEKRLPESTNLIWVGDMTVISGQTVNPSSRPSARWTTMTYANFRTALANGTVKADAMLVGTGF